MLHYQIRHSSRLGLGRKNPASGSVRLHALLAVLTGVAGILYVFLVNDLSTKGYEIQSLKMMSATTAEELAKIKNAASSAQSADAVASRLKEYPFVPEGVVEYARGASPVAYRGGNP